jgi:hypothetical protein
LKTYLQGIFPSLGLLFCPKSPFFLTTCSKFNEKNDMNVLCTFLSPILCSIFICCVQKKVHFPWSPSYFFSSPKNFSLRTVYIWPSASHTCGTQFDPAVYRWTAMCACNPIGDWMSGVEQSDIGGLC